MTLPLLTPNWLMQDLTAQSAALASGAITSLALTQQVLAQIGQRNPQLNAYLHVDATGALQAAAQSDARRVAGQTRGLLDGLTLAVKDNIDVATMPTTAGMATRRGRVAAVDAFVVQQLRSAGMVILGKLNMHEAALGATTNNPHYGPCDHPVHTGYTPGGSSGGSACAVAAGLCALALGSDTMGSVRVPASYCGVVGFKAGFGAVSTRGSVACGYSLDHIGPLTRSLRDLLAVVPAMLVFDVLCADARRWAGHAAIKNPRWVVAQNIQAAGATAEVALAYERAVQALRARGDAVTEISIAHYDFSRARRAGLLMVEADLLVEHAADWREQPANFSPELSRLLRYGEQQSAAAYAGAARVVAQAHALAARWFGHGDVMLLPSAPQTAFRFDAAVPANQADFTSVANMAGIPALSAPLPVAPGSLPIGLQCIAPAGAEATLLNLNLQGICTA